MIDYHIHTEHSIDAAGSVTEYCNRALEIGLKEICFTNHCELDPERNDSFISFDGKREFFSRQGLLRMREEIFEARHKYEKKGLKVKFGIEVGYYKGIERPLQDMIKGIKLDFVIGAVHCLEHICIDSSKECKKYFDEYNAQQLMQNYFMTVKDLIDSNMFDSLAHIDVYKKYGKDHYGKGINEVPADLLNDILTSIKENHIALELNTGGMRFMNEFYPAPRLMKMASEKGLELVTIGSDSHRPQDLGKDLSLAFEYLRSNGFNAVCTFNQRHRSRQKF